MEGRAVEVGAMRTVVRTFRGGDSISGEAVEVGLGLEFTVPGVFSVSTVVMVLELGEVPRRLPLALGFGALPVAWCDLFVASRVAGDPAALACDFI